MTAVKPAQIYFSLPGRAHHHEPFSSGFAPFNSGTWSLDVDLAAGMISLDWDNVTSCVTVESVKVVSSAIGVAPVTHPAFEGGNKFPDQKSGGTDFYLPPGVYFAWVRIELVITSGPIPIEPAAGAMGPAESPHKDRKAAAKRNTSKQNLTDSLPIKLTRPVLLV